MKVAIIGAGNMGGAIASALDTDKATVTVSNPSVKKLETLKSRRPTLNTTTDNRAAAHAADIIILAVKPWVLPSVIEELKAEIAEAQALVSVVAGFEPTELRNMVGQDAPACYYVIPNTAVAIGEGMTFICSEKNTEHTDTIIRQLLSDTGKLEFVEPRQMNAGMALASCGIAYAMRYIRAAVEGGVQLGLRPDIATKAVAQTLRGAAMLLEQSGSHPEEEIDKVTTPGGLTIRGLNAMEEKGFSASVIAGLTKGVS